MNTTYQAIQKRAKALEKETVRFLADMVRTPSFSSKEKQVIAVIKKEMKKVGFDEVRVDGLGSIIGRIGKGRRVMAFDAHIDTVVSGRPRAVELRPLQAARSKTARSRAAAPWTRRAAWPRWSMPGKIMKELGLNDQFTIWFAGTVMEEDCDGLCWQLPAEGGEAQAGVRRHHRADQPEHLSRPPRPHGDPRARSRGAAATARRPSAATTPSTRSPALRWRSRS